MNGTPNTFVLARKSTLLLCLSLTMTLVWTESRTSAQSDGAAPAETPAAETPAAETPAAEADGETPVATTAAAEEAEGDEEGTSTGTALDAPTSAVEEETDRDASDATGERTEEEEEEAEVAQAASEPLAWRNSFFSWTHGVSMNSFVRDGQQTYNPTYTWSFSLIPRWYLDARTFLVASLGVSYELTDSDFTTTNHELLLSDALIELRHTLVVDRFVFIPAARLTFPSSKFSQAFERYFNTGLGLTTVLQIPELLGSNLALGLSYRRWWSGSNVVVAQGSIPGGPAGTRPSDSYQNLASAGAGVVAGVDSLGGATQGVDRLLAALTYNITPFSGFTLTLQGIWIWDRSEDNAEAYLSCDRIVSSSCDSTVYIPQDPTQQRWTWFTYYTLAAAYDVQPWLNLALGVANSGVIALFFNSDGSVRSPFNNDTQVYLSATVTLDGLYGVITAGGEEDGLTPEERQRRRQGLAAIEDELLEEILSDPARRSDDSETDDHGVAAPSTVAF